MPEAAKAAWKEFAAVATAVQKGAEGQGKDAQPIPESGSHGAAPATSMSGLRWLVLCKGFLPALRAHQHRRAPEPDAGQQEQEELLP